MPRKKESSTPPSWKHIQARGAQRDYFTSLKKNVVTICHGCPGTGKSLLALYVAMTEYQRGAIERVVYCRPNVGLFNERDTGFLPGTKFEKMLPLAGPVLDNLTQFMGLGEAEYHLQNTIELCLLADLRGRSFENAFIILDEAQNAMPASIKTFLTRLGVGAAAAIIGDTEQCDLAFASWDKNGLLDAIRRLEGVDGVNVVRLGADCIQRHPVIPQILERY